MNEDCSRMSCSVPRNAVQSYLQQYSLNQVVVKNTEFVAVINGVTVVIPAGTFSYPITESISEFGQISFQGCQSLISVSIPAGSTFAEMESLVQGMLNEAAQQQAQCNAPQVPQAAPAYLNQQVSVASGCTDPALTISASLPAGITQSGNNLVCAAGVFSSNASQADANQRATEFVEDLLEALFSTGGAACNPCAPDVGPPVPASWAAATLPSRLRIKNYSTVKPNIVCCSACDASAAPELDGNLDQRDDIFEVYLNSQSPVALNGKKISGGSVPGISLYLNAGVEWQIAFFCQSTTVPHDRLVWVGNKTVGDSPVGRYIFDPSSTPSGTPCLDTLGCLDIEEY